MSTYIQLWVAELPAGRNIEYCLQFLCSKYDAACERNIHEYLSAVSYNLGNVFFALRTKSLFLIWIANA